MHTHTIPIPSWLQHDSITTIMQAFSSQGHTLRVVGGCVRDTLLGMPVHDIDACTTANPQETIDILTHAQIRAIPTGIQHGTVTAYCHGRTIEITTLRADILCDGRHAHVHFTDDWQADAQRRDFTINALSMDANGTIYDYTDGLADIAQRRIRFIGDAYQRIREDYLRILRFFRFYATHGDAQIQPDSTTLDACTTLQDGLHQLSSERIQHEMLRLLRAGNPSISVMHMHRCGIDTTISALKWDQFEALQRLLAWENAYHQPAQPWLRLAVLTSQQTTLREAIPVRWKCSRADTSLFHALCRIAAIPQHESAIKSFIRRYGSNMALLCLGRDIALGANDEPHFMHLCQTWQPPTFPITGNDLIACGYLSGKTLGETLRQLEEQWEESDYRLSKMELLNRL